MKIRTILSTIAFLFITANNVHAGTLEEWTDFVINDVKDIWNEDNHKVDLYIPLYAWHNRLTYDKEHIDKYNENPWGAGLGFSHYNDENTWSGIYAMAFKDSNSYLETYFGYARQWNWCAGDENQWHIGAGYTLGLTQRHEYSYIPIPLPLPMIGFGYRNIEIHGAYVPGIKNDGNVMFTFARIYF